MGGEDLTVQLIKQLRAALALATETGDEGAIYFVRRALAACTVRWGMHEKLPPSDDGG